MYSITLTFKAEIGLVAGGITNSAVATGPAFLVVKIEVIECRTLNPGLIK